MKSQENKKIRLLFVDDEEEFLVSSAQALKRRGIDVTTALDGTKGLKMAEENEFDVAVLDIKMPGIDGIDLFHRMQEMHPDLPIILLTGHGTVPQAFETSKKGVFDYLSKPCEMDTLAKVIHEAVAQSIKPTETPAEIHIKEKADTNIQVLIVDDEVDLLKSLKKTLQRRGMDIFTAQNGEQALECLGKTIIEVVVLDIKMPGKDGLKVLEQIRHDFPNVVVLFLTGHPTVTTALQGMKQGAFDYVIKPPDVDDLAKTIHDAFQFREKSIAEQQQNAINVIRERFPD